jgi:phosphohistidine swiveling domain-containing protein
MVNSEKSGIAFSVHPVTEDYNQLIIEAGLGLGEAIVSGSVTPDAYVVEKEPRRVIDTNVSHQTRALYRGEAGDNVWVDLDEEKAAMQVLSEKEVLELSELIIHIEKHYGFPCDIEWAYEGGKFYITQSRPITTLSPKDESSSASNIHPVKDHLRVADYELTFEGQGMTYIYEIALHKHYLPPVSVSVVTKGVVQEFMALKSLEAMDEKGLHTKPEDIQNGIQEMDAAIASARKEMEQILSAPLDAQSIKEAFKLSARIAKAYYFFDPHFWNSLYELSKTDATAKKSVDLVQEYKNVAREYFNEVYFGNGYIPRLIQKMSDVSEVSVEDLFQYSEDELCELMEGTKVADKIIAERKELFVMIKDGDSKRAILSKEDGMHFVESFFAGVEKAKVTTAFHGKSAHTTGKKVRGQVCLITRDYTDEARMQKEMEAMQKGDILVTQTTDPEMMPALRKAAAAVTDIGGMLSHTAITARELNIPCIVDTKIATQVLKNGDLVEVDADTGTVTLVK